MEKRDEFRKKLGEKEKELKATCADDMPCPMCSIDETVDMPRKPFTKTYRCVNCGYEIEGGG